MTRSYSLTFAAATVRLAGLPILVLARDPVVAITCTFWSWILNLVVAEWVIRRRSDIGAPTVWRKQLRDDTLRRPRWSTTRLPTNR